MGDAFSWIQRYDSADYSSEFRCALGKLARLSQLGNLQPQLLEDFETEVLDAWLQHPSVFHFLNVSETMAAITDEVNDEHSCSISGEYTQWKLFEACQ